MLNNLLMLPFRLVWNLSMISLAIGLTIMWNVFLWGSIALGIVVLLLDAGILVIPMVFLMFTTELWPEYYRLTPVDE